MTPVAIVSGELVAWRLDLEIHHASWDSGIGAGKVSGRWNKKGHEIVYASLDPALCLLEKAVHAGFRAIDIQAHTLTSFVVKDAATIQRVPASEFPNANWLSSNMHTAGQHEWIAQKLANEDRPFVLVPSSISRQSWNLIFDPRVAAGKYALRSQERYALDTRLAS